MTAALLDPWREDTNLRALVEVVLLGVAGGALGCWIVFYRLSYSAESLAHALLPGLVLAALAGIPLVLGGAAGVLVAALAVALAGRTPRVGADTAVAVVVTTLFGLGALLALAPDTPARLQELMFGDVLALTDGDLVVAAAMTAIVVVALRVFHPLLTLVAFDRAAARALGRSPLLADALLMTLLAAVLVVAVQGLGNLLVVALLVAPAAAARLLAGGVAGMMALSAAIAVSAGIGGLLASYHLHVAAGAAIAAALVLAYAAAGAAATLRGRPA